MVRWKKSIVGLLIGLAFAVVYLFLAFGAAGAGHGTGIFFAAILPYGVGLLLFPALGFLAGNLRSLANKIVFVSILTIHYALVINFLRLDWISEATYFEKMWNYSPLAILLPTGLYFAGQLILWFMFIRSLVVRD